MTSIASMCYWSIRHGLSYVASSLCYRPITESDAIKQRQNETPGKPQKMTTESLHPSDSSPSHRGHDGIDNASFSMDDEGAIECLTDDALFTIFSFLSLVDRGRVARVCKRWNGIMKDSRIWTFINFWQACESTAINPWTNEEHTLRLLQTYANGGLRTIHLKVIGSEVLLFLRQHCPNVEVFSFWPPRWPANLSLDSKFRPVPHFANTLNDDMKDTLQVSRTVVKVQLTFMGVEAPRGGAFVDLHCGSFTHALLCRLSRCRHLRHLSLAHCDGLDLMGMRILTENLSDLEELWLMNVKTEELEERNTSQDMIECIATNLTKLSSFRFIATKLDVNFDLFFENVSKRGKLKQLWIGRGPYFFTEDAFSHFCQSLPDLEELVLEACTCVTDEVIKSIGQNLKKLKVLNLLQSGFYTVESVSSYLNKHPTLKYTNVPGVQLST